MWKPFLFFALCAIAPLQAEEGLVVNLKDPEFSHGVLQTDKGGVVTAPGLRIQAKNISYTDKVTEGRRVQKIVAEGDLMIEYGEQVFIGERLEYDLLENRGSLIDGKTFVDIWFIGGEKIELKPDGSFVVYGGYITTSENADSAWELKAGAVKISPGGILSAKNIRLKLAQIPIFWLPSFKSNLKFFRDAPLRFRVLWDKGIGPRISARYRFLSWQEFNAYLRLDYRLKLGPGAALETEYISPNDRTYFVTRSYGAFDKSFPNEKGNRRYRLQGLLTTVSPDEKTEVHLQWDKMSDDRMVSDFKDPDFEVNTQKSTYFQVVHSEDNSFGTLRVRPRINSFQTLNQQLPYLVFGLRPFEVGRTGVIGESAARASFLDYTFPDTLEFHLLLSALSRRG